MKYEGYLENVAVISDTGSRNPPDVEEPEKGEGLGVGENVTRALIEPMLSLSLLLMFNNSQTFAEYSRLLPFTLPDPKIDFRFF